MNLDQFSGGVKQVRGALKERWGVLINADKVVVSARRDQLLGRIQQLQGDGRAASRKQLRQWEQTHADLRMGLARPR